MNKMEEHRNGPIAVLNFILGLQVRQVCTCADIAAVLPLNHTQQD